MGAADSLAVTQLHDAVGTIVDVAGVDGETVGTFEVEAIGTAAIEVAVGNHIPPSALHADDTTLTVAALSVTNGEVSNRTIVTVDEVQAEGVTRLHHDARVLLTLNNQLLHVDQRQLATIEHLFADHRLAPTSNAP